MNLKTFAVRQKLKENHRLLDYVVDNRDVPIQVLEDSFQELLAGLEDAEATQLIEDPDTLLGTRVPVPIKRDAAGGYEIEGDIPDTLMEAIQLVHKKTPDGVVTSLVNYNMGILYGQRCDVISVTLQEEAEKTVLSLQDLPKLTSFGQEEPELFPEEDALLPEEDLASVAAAAASAAPEAGVPKELPEEDVLDESPEEEPEEEERPEGELPEEEAMPDGQLPEEEPEMAAITPEADDEEAEAARFSVAVRRIYDRLVDDIRSFGLDKRLQLEL